MPELNYLLLQDLITQLRDINKSLTGIRTDLQNINDSLEALDNTLIRVH